VRRLAGAWLILVGMMEGAIPGPERVLVIVNQQSGLSRRIGELYARKRSIPERQVCRIQMPEVETITRRQFNTELEPAVAACLRDRQLDEQIFYLVLAQGVPLRVKSENGGGTNADGASVDSELTLLYRRLRGQKFPEPGWLENPFFRQRDTPFDHRSFPMYLVTRLAAYTFADVERIIDQSLAARNQGKVVIDLRSGDDEEGNNWLRTTAVLLPPDRVVFDKSAMVITKVRDAIGYASWGSNDKNRRERFLNFQWYPGALMTEFVSTNGRTFQEPPQTWTLGSWRMPWTWFMSSPQSLTADYLREGATGASGHVDEPYLTLCPRPDILFPAYVMHGRNLAEAYWMSIPSLSWMNIVVGDPLCRLQ
jgi:uncharacterized protein (TIGR03790 family)